jgi:uncharacterized phage protein (TIGR01671 family)
MREIKFRAWEDDAEEFCYFTIGDLLFGTEGFNISSGLDRIKDMLEETSKNLSGDERIQQYTGLRDKNGKEIYEGDIVQMQDGIMRWDDRNGPLAVVFEDGAFVPFGGQGEYSWEDGSDGHVAVIGNIYENPKLLNIP